LKSKKASAGTRMPAGRPRLLYGIRRELA